MEGLMARSMKNVVEDLEDTVNKNPDSRYFSRLADKYRKNGDIPRAIELCIDGLKRHPNYITGRIILGRCYLEQENYNDAVKEFTEVCKSDRRNPIALKMLADIFARQGFSEKAGDLYSILHSIDPYNSSINHLRSQYKGSGTTELFDILGIPIPKSSSTEASSSPSPRLHETSKFPSSI
jgi:tetratricopeptide (TPR) repeat protein